MKQDHTLAVMGFHAVPSMPQLHLHVMCQDRATPGLKTKKHWLSFTSSFLIPMGLAQSSLQQAGHVAVPSGAEDLLKQGLFCHRCEQGCKDMPSLKRHIDCCKAIPHG